MVCYYPILGRLVTYEDGHKKMVFSQSGLVDTVDSKGLKVPCGRCIGCRLDKSIQWATRLMHENQMHTESCFITLTYDDDHLPEDMSLDVSEFQRFMKRLRKEYGTGIRFYHCGEYGDQYGRPHYHALLFGIDFVDRVVFREEEGYVVYTSEKLSELWQLGFSTVTDVTFRSAAYVARYIMKKVNGELAEEHYKWADVETGIVYQRRPEYATMSRRPGIGRRWFEKYKSDLYPNDYAVVNGKKCKVPRYYDDCLKLEQPDLLEQLKDRREIRSLDGADDCTPARLAVREKVQQASLGRLTRKLEV